MNTDFNKNIQPEHTPPSFKLVISKEAQDEINELCTKISNTEWSGTVFFTISGDTNNIADLTITVVKVFLQDIGTSTYTEYEFTPEFANFLANNSELMSNTISGHIHSHHSMKTFFSGTDAKELEDSVKSLESGIFFSLIVNNDGEYTAGLALAVKAERSTQINYSIPTYLKGTLQESGYIKDTTIEVRSYFTKYQVEQNITLNTEIDKRIAAIKAAKQLSQTIYNKNKADAIQPTLPFGRFSDKDYPYLPTSYPYDNYTMKNYAETSSAKDNEASKIFLKILTLSVSFNGNPEEAADCVAAIPMDAYSEALDIFIDLTPLIHPCFNDPEEFQPLIKEIIKSANTFGMVDYFYIDEVVTFLSTNYLI